MLAAERNDLLELLDDRIGTHSTLITSQLPVKAWHTDLNDPTVADAILDGVVHSSHKIALTGARLLREIDNNRDGAAKNEAQLYITEARETGHEYMPARGASDGQAGARIHKNQIDQKPTATRPSLDSVSG